ncbi:MAG TPA: DEAD/DEAH box helicase [Acidimicrobiales bacterium]|nr:DEAD/DEAH box helicase [Acidimicrobiales bacterium]
MLSTTFSKLGVPERLVACLQDAGITEPYPIQAATLPDALRGADLFAQSPTGSGKTLAFGIPLVARLAGARSRHPRALVLAPTRELAAQITEAVRPLARVSGLRVAPFYGGTGYQRQLDSLARGLDVVVGCPGRLIDLLERGALHLSGVEVVVVDEADRLADMGFLPAVRRLIAEVAREHQTMLFSATLTKEVERLVRDQQVQPARHVLEQPSDDLGSRTHEFWLAKREDRARLTTALVATHSSSIVFCRTKHGADRLARQLSRAGLRVVALHGDRSQPQRDRAISQFREGRADVLVGTDVASRGLHVDGVECVVHFDPPADVDTYVHRSGRTGRAGASGRVVSLVCPDQERQSRQLASGLGLDARLGPPPRLPEPGAAARVPAARSEASRERQSTAPSARATSARVPARGRSGGTRRRARAERAGSSPREGASRPSRVPSRRLPRAS